MQTTIKLTIELCQGNEMPDTFTIKGEVPNTGPRIIDTSEKVLLELFYPAMRQTLERHLEGGSQPYGKRFFQARIPLWLMQRLG